MTGLTTALARITKMVKTIFGHAFSGTRKSFKKNWIGFSIIVVTTLVFFAPLIIRIGSYSEGGDAMFNAWTLSRNHHCLLRQGCPTYTDGNIYFPNKNSMLFSETQLSAGALTLPLHFINDNPVFAYNVWTILSYFFAGMFMYLLAKRLSQNHELVSVMAGLIFEFAPVKLGAGAPSHLQNLSIFYLPLIILAAIRYIDTSSRRYLTLFVVALVLQFYASWYQMIFVGIAVGVFLFGSFLQKNIEKKQFLTLVAGLAGAFILTLPLALRYSDFSKQNGATFTTTDQITYSSSVVDFLIPYDSSLAGRIYHSVLPTARATPYNPDSYATIGITMSIVSLFVAGSAAYLLRKKPQHLSRPETRSLKQIIVFCGIGITGFLLALGPVIKLEKNFAYRSIGPGVLLAIPAPWLLINRVLPQLSFIRAIGRINVLLLFAACCLLAYLPFTLKKLGFRRTKQRLVLAVIIFGLLFELLPLHIFRLSNRTNAYNMHIPTIYQTIADDPAVDNILILRSKQEYTNDGYPFVRAEDVLWAGYHNKNIFNGYSGYEPKQYGAQYADFVDLKQDDIPKMKSLGIKHVMIDNSLTPAESDLASNAHLLGRPILNDERFSLYRL